MSDSEYTEQQIKAAWLTATTGKIPNFDGSAMVPASEWSIERAFAIVGYPYAPAVLVPAKDET